MRTLKTPLNGFSSPYPLERLAPPSDLLFLDIETTGLSPASSRLYLIGCIYYEAGLFHAIQWFATAEAEEKELLTVFFQFAKKRRVLVHFNGSSFDLPFLLKKCEQYGLPYSFEDFEGVDLYRRISPYRDLLGLADCKQRTLEAFLNVSREDPFSGRDLIEVYQKYLETPTDIAYHALMQHNVDDLRGMLSCLPLLSYNDLFTTPLMVKKAQANYYHDNQGHHRQELLLKCHLSSSLPYPVTCREHECYLAAEGTEVLLRVPIYEEEMKYFYANYQDYYYLPFEDTALHKSVASFVDKAYREKAQPSNCYTRKLSSYLPQWDAVFTPFFKRSYDSEELFFELTEELKSDREAFSRYITHIMQMFFQIRTRKKP